MSIPWHFASSKLYFQAKWSATGTDADCFCILGSARTISLIVGVVGISDQGWRGGFFKKRGLRMKISRKSNGGAARRARLAAYMATGVGAIGLGTSSQAAVIPITLTGNTGDNNMGLAPGTNQNFYFIPGSTLFAANAYIGNTGVSVQGISGGGIAATGSGFADTPIKFGPGSLIGPTSGTFENSYTPTMFKNSGRTVGDFGPNSFLGFRTEKVGGVNYYGYIEVLWTASTNTFKLVSAAYEDTGAAIQTPGGGGAVPEPASGAVVALLMGGTALRQWRKKRRDQETACDESLAS